MKKISIENLGPIDGHFEMDIDKKLTILIGEQATGKSTIARAVYFSIICMLNEVINNVSGVNDILLKKHVDLVQQYFRRCYVSGKVLLSIDDIIVDYDVTNGYKVKVPDVLSPIIDSDAIYIPAGRSTIPLIFESYVAARNINVDPFFDYYLTKLDRIRKEYQVPIKEILSEEPTPTPGGYTLDNANKVASLMGQILKANYRFENGNERLYYGNDASVPVTTASSGQQEILYMLLTLFSVLRDIGQKIIIIEEPEAHIFPAAQKLFMEIIARVINGTESRFIITTHSPYILTSANLLMHSAKVENYIDSNDEKVVIEPKARIEPNDVSAYVLERNGGFSYRSIIDDETGLIRAEEIDEISDVIDNYMSNLVDLEVKHGL